MFPIYKKELQSFFYTPFAYTLSGLFLLLFTYMLTNKIANITGHYAIFSFTEVFYNAIIFFIFLIPILTMRTFSDERKFGTEVLLMSSPVSVLKIVLAKFFANVTVFIFMLAGTIVFPIITEANGEVVYSQLICAYIGFFLWGTMFICVGMLVSSFTESSIIAAIIGELIMFVFLFLDDFANSGFISQYPTLQNVLNSFAAQPRFAYFSQGFIRLSDIVFFLSAILVLLAWNYVSIEKKRWNRG